MTSERKVYVYIQLPNSLEIVAAGLLTIATLSNGTQIGRFGYGKRYLERSDAVEFDPFQLPLTNKVYEFTERNGIPSAVRDASPDLWGRRVIEHKLQRTDLDEVDYLLYGPQDGAGYLSFGLAPLPPAPVRTYNRTHQLSALVDAAQKIDEGLHVDGYLLEQLDPGTSMGGARPKATVEDAQHLWLCKFPEKGDPFNMQRVEYATLELARRTGLRVTGARLETIGLGDVLMLQRFDREYTDQGYLRLGLVSGVTVLDCSDSPSDRDGWSYPLLAENLRRWSVEPEADSAELFKRMVFNAAVTNNDDHPRNHALLHTQKGWRLSPAYDLVPHRTTSLDWRNLALTVGDHGRTASIYNLVSQAKRFGFTKDEALGEINQIVAVVQNWRAIFAECGVAPEDCDCIKSAILPERFFDETPPDGGTGYGWI